MRALAMVEAPLAHSARSIGAAADPYARHVSAVHSGAHKRAEAMLRYAIDPPPGILDAIDAASSFHDLGKLDPLMQSVLRRGRNAKFDRPHDHIDAGVAHLSAKRGWTAAWIVRAHHAPGLPQNAKHFTETSDRRLRGVRWDDKPQHIHDEQKTRTDANLERYLADHERVVGPAAIERGRPIHGLPLRLALSCLVDADHADTSFFDTGRLPAAPAQARWEERLESLCHYVRGLPPGESDAERARNTRRAAFFDACLNSNIQMPLLACEGPVGLGKTTAVAAYLLRRARDAQPQLRRLIIVAPYTNILTQTAKALRKALVLPGERPDRVIVEHHHRADFDCDQDRDLAVLWQAPIILTTAVGFFETLSACDPASLRKLHALPGSAIFIDESHAALPTRLWPQNWRWLRELSEKWSCRVVFASGSLARFWENPEIVPDTVQLPELLPPDQATDILRAERHRIRYSRLANGNVVDVEHLVNHIPEIPGPRLVILNTVQNAAVVANAMRKANRDVLHLSTALTPRDRERILKLVENRLRSSNKDWTLVATSCVEAGVDLSFRSALRERFSASSIIQVGGRVNRHGEYDADGGGIVYDFALGGAGVTQHPAAKVSAEVLREMMTTGEFDVRTPAEIVTKAMRVELSRLGGLGADQLLKAEKDRDYPSVKEHGRVIVADTRLVVVDKRLKKRLTQYQPVGYRALLRGSVQLWATKIEQLGLQLLPARGELYGWDDAYDPDFLGIMAGVLRTDAFLAAGGGVI